jgi:5-methylcytosine-specific restriction endonuclease McrA
MNYERNKRLMYRRDRWHCRNCNTTQNLTPHHIMFQSQGGDDSLDNLVTLCLKCHDDVHAGRLGILVPMGEEGVASNIKFKRLGGWKP